MIESLTAWVSASMIVAWLSIGTIVGIKPKDIATAIATASAEKPLFDGEDGPRKTAALLTAVGVYESGYRQIHGDCKNKPPGWPGCGKENDSQPTSWCFLQVHFIDGVEKVKGYTPEELMADPLACARAGREIMRDSIKVNTDEKERLKKLGKLDEWYDEPLKSYAGTSGPAKKRYELAKKLFKSVPWQIRCD